MSYKLYIENSEVEIKDINRLAQNKQVNNITNIHQRQTNATNSFALPKTPNNVRVMEFLGVVGNTSNLPYKKLNASLLDTITGEWLIYNGWAVITNTAKDYKVVLYDGIIDFFKAIDNKTLTDVNISGLNHVKNVPNVIASFSNTLPYIYILGDFNGNNYDAGTLNIDYQVPSARISYIWKAIHAFAGFTYTGNIFQKEKFLNLFMTFPKPAPISGNQSNYVNAENHLSGFSYNGTVQTVDMFPSEFTANSYVVKENNSYKFNVAGKYKVKGTGQITTTSTFIGFPTNTNTSTFNYYHKDSANNFLTYGIIDTNALGYVILDVSIGDTVTLICDIFADSNGDFGFSSYLSGNFDLSLDILTGYQVNFEDVLVEFLATDFVKEVINHFCLTPFKDPYSNNIEYRTLTEIIQEPNVVDWSNKNPVKTDEKYIVGSYAQSNLFQFSYDKQGEVFCDGRILIENKNLAEKTVVVKSKFFAPSSLNTESNINGVNTVLFKLWDKEIKDDGTIEYKDLSNRFYLLKRQISQNSFITIKSVVLNQIDTYSGTLSYVSFYRLSWRELIVDNYSQIRKILNNAKIIDVNFFLTAKDVRDFDFKRLIYVEQFSSYYMVNKIVNFIKNKPTKVELIEIDSFVDDGENDFVIPYSYISIYNISVVGCTAIIDFTTDAILPTNIKIEFLQIGGFPFSTVQSSDVFTVNATTNQISFTYTGLLINGTEKRIRLWLGEVGFGVSSTSELSDFSNCIPPSELTFIDLISLETIAIIPDLILNTRRVKVTYLSDFVLPKTIKFWYDAGFFGGVQSQDILVNSNEFTVDIPHDSLNFFTGGTTVNSYNCYMSLQNVISDILPSNG